MGLRELFILVLGLAIVAVFLRGVYVAIKARKGQLRMQLDKNIPSYDPEELTLSELPNGGARLVERSFAQIVQQNSDFAKQEKKSYGNKSSKSIPVLMDSVDDDAPARPSTMASARQSARKKHVMGRSETVASQLKAESLVEPPEPSGSSFDVSEDTAPAAPIVVNDAYEHKLAPKPLEPDDDYDDDPIANHVFVDEAAETAELATGPHAAKDDEALEDNYSGYSGDDIEAEDESGSMLGSSTREPDDTLESSSDYSDEDILEHDEDDFEDEDFVGDGAEANALDNSRHQSADDLEDEDEDEDEDYDYDDEDELDDEIESEPFDSVYAEDNTEHKAFGALGDESELEDDDYNEEETDLDDSDDAEEDEDYAADDAEQDDQFDYDEDEYDRDYDEPVAHDKEPSGPRSWLKWAGNKISGMGGPSDEDEAIVRGERAEPVIGQSSFDEVMTPAPRPRPRPRPVQPRDEPAPKAAHFDKTHQSQLDLGMPAAEQEAAAKPPRENKRKAAKPAPEKKSESAVSAEFSEVLVINVVAKTDRDIAGIDMLQVLMSNGLIFGEMSIFHRHLEHNRESPVLFSVANMVNPGTFDLNQIGEFSTKGLSFFLTLPNVATSMQGFEKMLEAAQQIRVALDCDLKDDSRSVMTAQTIEHYRQRVRDFDLRQLRQSK
jgi:cell division protein ZipA